MTNDTRPHADDLITSSTYRNGDSPDVVLLRLHNDRGALLHEVNTASEHEVVTTLRMWLREMGFAK